MEMTGSVEMSIDADKQLSKAYFLSFKASQIIRLNVESYKLEA